MPRLKGYPISPNFLYADLPKSRVGLKLGCFSLAFCRGAQISPYGWRVLFLTRRDAVPHLSPAWQKAVFFRIANATERVQLLLHSTGFGISNQHGSPS